jgi:hypothetical protein
VVLHCVFHPHRQIIINNNPCPVLVVLFQPRWGLSLSSNRCVQISRNSSPPDFG